MRTRSLMLGCLLALGVLLVGWALGIVDLGGVSPVPSGGIRPGLQVGGGGPVAGPSGIVPSDPAPTP
jgi:hypothetical protein